MYSGRDRGVGQSLGEAIRQIGNAARLQAAATRVRAAPRPLCTGLVLLAMAPTSQAVTLGEIAVHSPLGRPLDASVPLSLAAGETLTKGCIAPVRGGGDLAGVPAPHVQIPLTGNAGSFALRVTTDTPLYEPMYSLALQVNCPGTPALMREYVLMLDLPATAATLQSAVPAVPALSPAESVRSGEPARTPVTQLEPAAAPVAAPARVRSRMPATASDTPITAGSRYRVSAGDTLSSIAARVSDRGMSLWQMADLIFAANPEAFIRNDPDLIRLGSEIVIPNGSGAMPAAAGVPALPRDQSPRAASPDLDTRVPVSPPEPVVVLPAAPEVLEPAGDAPVPDLAEVPGPVIQEAAVITAPGPIPAAEAEPVASAAPATQPAPEPQVSPLAAGAAGALFGFLASGLLWLRRASGQRRSAAEQSPGREPADRRYPRTNAPLPVCSPVEPAISVSYTPADGPTATESEAAPVLPAEDITAQLEELFDADASDADSGKTVAARIIRTEDAGTFGSRESELQVLLPAPEETLQSPTLHAPVDLFRDDTASNETLSATSIDLETLMTANDNGTADSQTLIEALKMLERDYESEATGSHVIDFDAARSALAGDDDATQVRRKKRSS